MSEASELLNSLSEDDIATYTAEPETEEHIVVGEDRFITVPDTLKRIAVQHDHNIETVTFDCPRYWDKHDMSLMKVYINYRRPDGVVGCYVADNVRADETNESIMHFDWTITKNVTVVEGTLTFLVCVREVDAKGYERNHWNSETNDDLYISEGLECDCASPEIHPDSEIIEGIPSEEDDVRFYDYDGTLLYSYALDEVQSISSLPNPPEHDGLISQGWNYDLDVIKSLGRGVNVCASYITDDGTTRLHIKTVSDGRNTVPLNIYQTVSDGVSIDWGDGSTSTISGTLGVSTTHTYSTPGEYTIKLTPLNGTTYFLGNGSESVLGSNKVYTSMLQRVEIGEGVTAIMPYSLQWCSSLSSITIPNGITSIGSYAFAMCSALKHVALPAAIDTALTIDGYAFNNCYSIENMSIPEGTLDIGNNAFNGCYNLVSISLPNSLEGLGVEAFKQCHSLKTIYLPGSIVEIGDNMFEYCISLENVTFGEGLTHIGAYAFSHCSSLERIDIPEGMVRINEYAFQYCTALKTVNLPESLTSIMQYVFYSCTSLSRITLPGALVNPATQTFMDCSSLTEVVLSEGIVGVANEVFKNCTALKRVVVPTSFTFVGPYAFQNCRSLSEFDLSNVKSMGDGAFSNCTSLRTLTLSGDIAKSTQIPVYAFDYCESLASVKMPPVTVVNSYSFRGCTGVANFDFSACTTVPTLTTINAFEGVADDCNIEVPSALYDEWVASTNWSSYADMIVAV